MAKLREHTKLKGTFKIIYSFVDYGHGKEKRVALHYPGRKNPIVFMSKILKYRELEARCFEEYKKRIRKPL